MSINELLEQYNLEVNEYHEVSLNDFFMMFHNSNKLWAPLMRARKSTAKYDINIENSVHFIKTWNLCRLIINSSDSKLKSFYQKHKNIIDDNILDKTKSIVDAHDNVFIYLGIKIPVVVHKDIYYFHNKTVISFSNNKIADKNLDTLNMRNINGEMYVSHKDLLYYAILSKAQQKFISWVSDSVLPHINDENNFKINSDEVSETCETINVDDYSEYYCVYFIKVRHNTYKYGDSYILKNRMRTHIKAFNRLEYVKVYKFEDFRQMKQMANVFKDWTKEKKINYKDSNDRVEMFKTTKKYTLEYILNKADEMYEVFNIPNKELIENRIVFKLINKLIERYGKNRALNMIKEEFSTEDEEYLRKKIFKQNGGENIIQNAIKEPKSLTYCNKCLCDKCCDRKISTKNINKYCKVCACGKCFKIKKERQQNVIKKKKSKKCPDCNTIIYQNIEKCHACYSKSTRKVERPPYSQLMQEIQDTSYVAVGQKYGVSDNAVRKWVKSYIASDPKFQNRKKINGAYRCENNDCNNKTTPISLTCYSCNIKKRKVNYFNSTKCQICSKYSKNDICNSCQESESEELIDCTVSKTMVSNTRFKNKKGPSNPGSKTKHKVSNLTFTTHFRQC